MLFNEDTRQAVPPFGTGDVITVMHEPVPGTYTIFKNQREIAKIAGIKGLMYPWCNLGLMGQSVSTGVEIPWGRQVEIDRCVVCFAKLGIQHDALYCRQGAMVKEDGRKQEIASDKIVSDALHGKV